MCYEQLNDPEAAIKLSKESFDAAIVDLDKLTDEKYKDACLILGLLRDNVTLWRSTDNGTLYTVYCTYISYIDNLAQKYILGQIITITQCKINTLFLIPIRTNFLPRLDTCMHCH